jgi:hypothetical protein
MNKDKQVFFIYYIKNAALRIKRKILRILHLRNMQEFTQFAGKNVLTQTDFNTQVYNLLQTDIPFMVSRFGSNEIMNIIEYLAVKYGIKKHMNARLVSQLNINAGVFPAGEEMAAKVAKYMLEYIPEIDFLGCWFRNMEDYILMYYATKAKPVRLKYLEPYTYEEPWSKGLKGKKVLVIHPFENTIKKQYEKKDLLFANPKVLPEFELLTLKAVQSIANESNGFKNWFAALDYMYEEALKKKFDVAILGCGAYGLPLAARLKQAGKQVIHLGGSVQILFGIKGNRWDNDPSTNYLYNDNWCRPMQEDTPAKANLIENSCYW